MGRLWKSSGRKIRFFFSELFESFRSKKFWFIVSAIFFSGFLFLAVLYILVLTETFGDLPDRSELRNITQDEASEVYSSDNVLMGRYYIQNRVSLALDSVPRHLVNALIATEDSRFYEHNGIDYKSLARVAIKTILMQKDESGGGSTITQQLAKNLYPRSDLGFFSLPIHKAREHIISLRLEDVYSKEQLLSFYLNTVSFGENTYGLETASKRFFNIHPSVLKVEEAAVLIGMLKGPSAYNPRTNYESSQERRNWVLSRMNVEGFLSKNELDSLKNTPISTDYRRLSEHSGLAPYFREFLRIRLKNILAGLENVNGEKYDLYTGGLRIHTTINSKLQSYAEKAISNHTAELQTLLEKHYNGNYPWSDNEQLIRYLAKNSAHFKRLKEAEMPEEEIWEFFNDTVEIEVFSWEGYQKKNFSRLDSVKYYLNFLHAGLLAMDPYSGAIRVWVGGINFRTFKYDHVLSRRQAGSTFKPILYAAAIENGFTPCEFLSNDTIIFKEYDNWQPRNADRKYGGFYSLKGALTNSVNTVSARLILETGIEKVANTAKDLGIKSDFAHVPSLALGTADVSLLEMIRAYSAFLNEGRTVEPVYIQRIEDSEGNIIYENEGPEYGISSFSPQTAEIMLQMLRNVVNRGTGAGIRSRYGLYNDMGGKTGTTQDHSDGWFISLTPDLIAGSWVGGEVPVVRFRSLNLGEGSAMAMPQVAQFLKQAYDDPEFESWYSNRFQFENLQNLEEIFDCPDFKERKRARKIFEIFENIFRGRDRRE
jgi:penicillin-binding protein 1A